jgi:hypothetical protein
MKGKSWTVSLDSINIISFILWMRKLRSRDMKRLYSQVTELVNENFFNEDLNFLQFFKALGIKVTSNS